VIPIVQGTFGQDLQLPTIPQEMYVIDSITGVMRAYQPVADNIIDSSEESDSE